MEQIVKFFNYDPNTGVLTWKIKTSNRIKVGDKIACVDKNGYVVVRVKNILYKAHRIIYYMVNGPFSGDIDHINRIKTDNRICNLRIATRTLNNTNRSLSKSANTSGKLGVSYCNYYNKYVSYIDYNHKRINLGYSKTKKEAILKRKNAEIKYYNRIFPA